MKNPAKKKHPIRRIVLPVALLGIAAILVADNGGFIIGNTVYEIEIPGLPTAFSGMRILQISDLHGREFGESSSRLIEHVVSESPDIIALTGDIADYHTDIDVLRRLIPQLVEIAPVYYVSGNHEWGAHRIDALAEILKSAGAVYLRNEYLPLEKDGERIILCGVEDPNSWAELKTPDVLISKLRKEFPDERVILLGHRNNWPETYPDLDVSLILCGHGHGGIIRLPFVGGLLDTPHALFPEYDAGVFESGSYKMVVSRGLSDSIPMPRFLNAPEVVTVILR